eukprot:m.143665 g.143665  ORF g.143665 m.143665 type:complete len:783 (+) comp16744_c0_seq1:183-2531(+)
MAAPAGDANDSQEKLLEEAQNIVKREAFNMKRSLDQSKLMDAIKHASTMLSELRTSLLSPKTYYELYMNVTDELRHLEVYLLDEFEKGRAVKDLYELVQYAGNIVPRLYLVVTVGTVYIKAKQVPTKDIMKDLVEMCRGVQHPLRGLFLRNYLLQSVKRDLPESLNGEDGTIKDSIDFILLNFAEMNKLWVRMQHQGHSRDKSKREQERQELKLLVGTNLVRLSSLEGVDVERYSSAILPVVLEQIVSCQDPIAQEYLMECVIQVFPDEFHLQTLDPFLLACGKLHAEVNVKNIIISLLDRLASYSSRSDCEIPKDKALFDIFSTQIAGIVKERPSMSLDDILALQISLVNLALKCYPDKAEYVDKVLDFTLLLLEKKSTEAAGNNTPAVRQLTKLMKIPVTGYPSIVQTLSLQHYVPITKMMQEGPRNELAVFLLQTALERAIPLTTTEQVSIFLDALSPLLKESDAELEKDEDYAAEQSLLGRVVHLFVGESPDVQFQMLSLARKQFAANESKQRLRHTLPSLVFSSLRLARVYHATKSDPQWSKKVQKIYQFCHQTATALAKAEFHELAIHLFLQSALATDATDCENNESIAYEFMSQAFALYEEEISDSKIQMSVISSIIGTLQTMSCFSEENHTPLITKCALISSKLVMKPDQCRCVCLCTHLFWSSDPEGKRDGKQVLQCLQRAGKVANNIVDVEVQVPLFIEILDNYILCMQKGVEQVSASQINRIGQLIRELMTKLESNTVAEEIRHHFANTEAYIRTRKADAATAAQFAEVQI